MKVLKNKLIILALIVSLGVITALSSKYNLRGGVTLESLTCKSILKCSLSNGS